MVLLRNEQSVHVGAVRVILMTASRHGDKQICSISRVSFLSESPTSNGLPKHLHITVCKAIELRVDVYQYHLSSHGKVEQMNKVIYRFARLRSGPIFRPTWSCTRPHLPELPPNRTRSRPLAPRLSSFAIHETTSVWVLSRVIRVACHPTWGCSGVRKEDPGWPWRLIQ